DCRAAAATAGIAAATKLATRSAAAIPARRARDFIAERRSATETAAASGYRALPDARRRAPGIVREAHRDWRSFALRPRRAAALDLRCAAGRARSARSSANSREWPTQPGSSRLHDAARHRSDVWAWCAMPHLERWSSIRSRRMAQIWYSIKCQI